MAHHSMQKMHANTRHGDGADANVCTTFISHKQMQSLPPASWTGTLRLTDQKETRHVWTASISSIKSNARTCCSVDCTCRGSPPSTPCRTGCASPTCGRKNAPAREKKQPSVTNKFSTCIRGSAGDPLVCSSAERGLHLSFLDVLPSGSRAEKGTFWQVGLRRHQKGLFLFVCAGNITGTHRRVSTARLQKTDHSCGFFRETRLSFLCTANYRHKKGVPPQSSSHVIVSMTENRCDAVFPIKNM